ncbi:MAG TPA: tRNA (adenosine(37)-N6)-threonylcarbamoyltransferase complex dimerization subunit type 1 TsaB [Gaiellales bacterium]
MLLLAIDTATTVAAACVWRDGEVLAEGERRGAHVAQEVLVLCQELVEQAGISPSEIEGVVGGVGPGSFTGVRVGLATARGLGLALGVPVAGASTLAALRAGAGDGAVACIDARRGEVFADGPGVPAAARAPEALLALLPSASVLVGDGAIRYRDVFEAADMLVPPDDDVRHAPAGRMLAQLAAEDGMTTSADPQYLRRPDAELAVQ